MNRRSLFKSLLGLAVAPLACFAKPKTPTIVLHVGTDAAGFRAMLPKIKREIMEAWAAGVRRDKARRAIRDSQLKSMVREDTEKACRRFKIYNIHNKGYRFLDDPKQRTHYD